MMFWNIKEKSMLYFTYLFKIQISNFLYIKLHMDFYIAVVNYEWSFGTSHIKKMSDSFCFGWRLCNRRTTTNNTPSGCSARWFDGGTTPRWCRGLMPSTGHCSALTLDQPPGLSSPLFHALALPRWPALCVSCWCITGELKLLSIQRWSCGECQERRDILSCTWINIYAYML